MANDYDVLIIGGGLAGLTASIYSARYGLSTGVIELMMGGASIINLEKIENFPGFVEGISGAELGPAAQEQAMNVGVDFIMAEATGIRTDGDYKVVGTDSGDYRAKAVIVAAGSQLKHLGIPGEEEFNGRGVSHCATCDGPMFMGETVGVVGGGDSAADEALTLTEYAEKVLVFHRRDELRAQKILQDRLLRNPKIEMVWNAELQEIIGEDTVSGVKIKNVVTNHEETIGLTGLFVYVGLEPNSGIAASVSKTDNAGHIDVNLSMETSTQGVYAVGDIRQSSARQLVASAGDGATAAVGAFNYIRSKTW
ncbi:MAG: thioredoxin-disulfide reductase [Dehalococcoidia bacterium]|nr:thioredoxin-disulfide reductase [Dehalococcoidia bacterium]